MRACVRVCVHKCVCVCVCVCCVGEVVGELISIPCLCCGHFVVCDKFLAENWEKEHMLQLCLFWHTTRVYSSIFMCEFSLNCVCCCVSFVLTAAAPVWEEPGGGSEGVR